MVLAAAVVAVIVAVLLWRGRRPPDPYYELGVVERHRVARDDQTRSFPE